MRLSGYVITYGRPHFHTWKKKEKQKDAARIALDSSHTFVDCQIASGPKRFFRSSSYSSTTTNSKKWIAPKQ